jgi:preprotein translocase subunit SecA
MKKYVSAVLFMMAVAGGFFPTLLIAQEHKGPRAEIKESLLAMLQQAYADRATAIGPDNMRQVERLVLLRVIDAAWIEQLQRKAQRSPALLAKLSAVAIM